MWLTEAVLFSDLQLRHEGMTFFSVQGTVTTGYNVCCSDSLLGLGSNNEFPLE
jgi:hypothetical protein